MLPQSCVKASHLSSCHWEYSKNKHMCRSLLEARINPLSDDATIKKIPLREAPEDLFSLGRTIMLLRGLCFALDLDIKVYFPMFGCNMQACASLSMHPLQTTDHSLLPEQWRGLPAVLKTRWRESASGGYLTIEMEKQ